MKVLEVAQELMRFKSETGNDEEIKKTFDYIKNMMSIALGRPREMRNAARDSMPWFQR